MTHAIVSRKEWGANPDSLPTKRMSLPAVAVYIHHSVSAVSTHPGADMRAIEKIGLQRFGQFSYSYCIHPEGTILEGCGDRVGAHTARRNSTSFGICLIGNYEQRSIKTQQIDSVRWLIAHLIATGKLRRGTYPTGGHRDVSSTACPGANAYRALDLMREPWAEPVPETVPDSPPTAVTVTAVTYPDGEDTLTRYDMFVRLDGNGKGWGRLEVPAATVVSLVANGPYPPADGYWNSPILTRQDRDGGTIVVVDEGPPGVELLVSVWAL